MESQSTSQSPSAPKHLGIRIVTVESFTEQMQEFSRVIAARAYEIYERRDRRPRVAEWSRRLSARPAFQTAVSWPDESGGGYEEVGLTTKR